MADNPMLPSLSVTQSLNKSWDAVTRNIWVLAGFTLLFYFTNWILGKVPLISIVVNLTSFLLTPCLFSAFHQISKGQQIEFRDFFTWTPKLGKLLLANLLMVFIVIVVCIPFIIWLFTAVGTDSFTYNDSDNFSTTLQHLSASTTVGMISYLLAAALIIGIPLFSFLYIVQFKDLSVRESFSLSWKFGKRNIGDIILFFSLTLGICILGVLALFIGLFVAIPVVSGMQFFYLRSIFPEEVPSTDWDFMNTHKEIR